jgi:hypothetical protein
MSDGVASTPLNYSVLRTSPFGSPLRDAQIGRTADLVGA